jgi:alkanesulfonate monooxygenase SsuD/methylene tetrahydromethanopterin reductase-like flavin-dependent oxidoreductase (luciferase family)
MRPRAGRQGAAWGRRSARLASRLGLGRTEHIVLAPGVTHVILKDPTVIAQQAATLDELTGGRTEVVFSVGNIAMLEQYGIEWRPRMLARLREAHHVLRTFVIAARSTQGRSGPSPRPSGAAT